MSAPGHRGGLFRRSCFPARRTGPKHNLNCQYSDQESLRSDKIRFFWHAASTRPLRTVTVPPVQIGGCVEMSESRLLNDGRLSGAAPLYRSRMRGFSMNVRRTSLSLAGTLAGALGLCALVISPGSQSVSLDHPTPPPGSQNGEPSYVCFHNGEPYALVFGAQACPDYHQNSVEYSPEPNAPNDPECIIDRVPSSL